MFNIYTVFPKDFKGFLISLNMTILSINIFQVLHNWVLLRDTLPTIIRNAT